MRAVPCRAKWNFGYSVKPPPIYHATHELRRSCFLRCMYIRLMRCQLATCSTSPNNFRLFMQSAFRAQMGVGSGCRDDNELSIEPRRHVRAMCSVWNDWLKSGNVAVMPMLFAEHAFRLVANNSLQGSTTLLSLRRRYTNRLYLQHGGENCCKCHACVLPKKVENIRQNNMKMCITGFGAVPKWYSSAATFAILTMTCRL